LGYYVNPETDDYYIRARHYLAQLGRFVARDPIGFEAGGASLYRYVGNGPTNAMDPSGNVPVWVWVGGGVIALVCIDLAACYGSMMSIYSETNDTVREIMDQWPEDYKGSPRADGMSQEGWPGDALQHCIGACEANQHPGPCVLSWFVRRQLTKKEQDESKKNPIDSKADLANNRVGFGITGDCKAGCLQALEDGRLTCSNAEGTFPCPSPPQGHRTHHS
jgi:RHS repeat-associated protein